MTSKHAHLHDHEVILDVKNLRVAYGKVEALHEVSLTIRRGEIVTVKCFEDNSLVKEQVDLPGKGKVLVVDGGASMRRALLGDMLAEKAAKNGWEGILVYGCVRDVDVLAQTDLGIQALASHPMKTDKRGIGDLNVAVTFGGVTFRPGEFIYADNNGVIISPSALQMPE